MASFLSRRFGSQALAESNRSSRGKSSGKSNPAGIPPEVFGHRLGNRSALEWVIDQYQVKPISGRGGARVSDPNRPDDLESIVRLVGPVVRARFGTVPIVESRTPAFGWPEGLA